MQPVVAAVDIAAVAQLVVRLLILRLRCNRLLRLLILLRGATGCCGCCTGSTIGVNSGRVDHHPATLSLAKIQNHPARRIRPSRLFAGITLLLSLSKRRASSASAAASASSAFTGTSVDTVRRSVAAVSGRIDAPVHLLHRIDFIIVILLARIILIGWASRAFSSAARCEGSLIP